ncbi:MAG TPA: hypothetical protein VEU33_19865 [Archangium sp.]|nr:hypothetical protein [Archangium sp.]
MARSAIKWSGSVLLVVLLSCQVARASSPGPQDESIRARLKACLLMGEMQCVVEQYLLLEDLGRMPGWLVAFQNAFAVANRRAGECEKVARAIHEGLRQFAQKPVFIRFSVEGEFKQLGFDVTSNGVVVRNLQVSSTGQHVAVKLGDKVIDVYTGLAGLSLREYLARLSTVSGSRVIHEVVDEL